MKRYYAPYGKEMREADDGEYYLVTEVDADIAELRALLNEVYEHGENSDLHRRIGKALDKDI